MKVINLTPHPLVLVNEGVETLGVIPPDGRLPRVQQTDRKVGELEIDGIGCIDIVETVFGKVCDLPEPFPGNLLVVSAITALTARAGGRSVKDLLIPSDFVRDDAGVVIGCRRFARLSS